jgi:hypothetical protein
MNEMEKNSLRYFYLNYKKSQESVLIRITDPVPESDIGYIVASVSEKDLIVEEKTIETKEFVILPMQRSNPSIDKEVDQTL